MVNFAELRQKAEKAKDASVTKMVNTRDKFTSVPSAKTNWDPNWKRAPPPAPAGSAGSNHNGSPPSPPPPLRTHPDASGRLPLPHPLRHSSRADVHSPLSHSPLPPPPARVKCPYPPHMGSTDQVNEIDWVNLSQEDKDEFFAWLDEFFSQYLNIALPPRREYSSTGMNASVPVRSSGQPGPPPIINLNSRPLS